MSITLFCVLAAPASAIYTETAYASYKKTVWTGAHPHMVLGYYIPHDTLGGDFSGVRYHPYIGGVDYYVLANAAPDHSNPQEWDFISRVQINSNQDRVELFVPLRYALAMNALKKEWKNQIYIKYYRR
ncbi:MAG: hypothetical protein PHI66_04425 [Candidatus Pacebacteria bacterium]|nr:hypothetical protein [Candidatus Paceibacterota bacterium]